MKVFWIIVLFAIFALAIRARLKAPSRAMRVLQIVRRGDARRITVASAKPKAQPAPQSRSSGGSHAPFLNPANHRQLPRRVRHTCNCPGREPRDMNRVHANVICINCRGSLPAKLAG